MEENEVDISNNLFKYATKELSQDAFICWLISWKNKEKENKELYDVANRFLKQIFKNANKEYKENTRILEITKQEKNSDILIKLNNGYYIIFEDKIFTTEHKAGNSEKKQLESYIKKIIKARKTNRKNIITVYYKMIDEADENKTADVIINRNDMVNILKKDIKNDIYKDYRENLFEINENIKNIKNEPIINWGKKPELFYTFEKKNKAIFKDLKITKQKGSTFIDWNYQEFKPKKRKKKIEKIYCFADLNGDRLEVGVVLKNVKKYDENYFEEIQERGIKYFNKFKGYIIKCRKANKKNIGKDFDTKRLFKIKMEEYLKCEKKQVKLKDLENLMNEWQKALNKMMEN